MYILTAVLILILSILSSNYDYTEVIIAGMNFEAVIFWVLFVWPELMFMATTKRFIVDFTIILLVTFVLIQIEMRWYDAQGGDFTFENDNFTWIAGIWSFGVGLLLRLVRDLIYSKAEFIGKLLHAMR